MSGMGRGLQANNPAVVAAFHTALLHQAIVVAILLALTVAAWSMLRLGQAEGGGAPQPTSPEPMARRVLRIGFGIIWIFDGILQAQPAMPLGMPGQVVVPSSATSPHWVQRLVGFGMGIWNRHPVPAAASAVWIQVGIGVFLLVAARGRWSQLAGLVSVGWGLVVWAFGESFGGIFAPGLSWMFGAPGAVLIYCVAGALVALPERAWSGRTLGRMVLGLAGVFLLGMAVLQAWPGRGFWQGYGAGHAVTGQVAAMAQTMSQTPQPAVIASWVSGFGLFAAQHGWAVNLVVVVTLAAAGLALLSGRPALVRPALAAVAILCLADWLLVEDLGFLGGVGTDPNSMIPFVLLLTGGYLALTRAPAPAAAARRAGEAGRGAGEVAPGAVVVPLHAAPTDPAPAEDPSRRRPWLRRGSPVPLLGAIAALGALGIVLVGAVPMAFAALNPHPDSILTEAVNGQPGLTNAPAPGFTLVDQHGDVVTLASLRGRAVALTFLDPVCTTDCPLIAQQFRLADDELGPADTDRTVFIAVVANPIYRALPFVQAFDKTEGLDGVPNWLYLTGSLPALERAWNAYGIQVQTLPAGAMVAHSENAFIIDPSGRLRALMGSDPGNSSTTAESLATLIAAEMRSVLG